MQSENDFRDAIYNMIDSRITKIHTALPGTVVSYDASTGRAQVKPSGTYKCPDDRELEYPIIHNVPIIMPTSGGGSCGVSMPIEAGDSVLLHFSQTQLDSFLTGNPSEDKRQHDLNDCIATPGLRADAHQYNAEYPNALVMSYKGSTAILREGSFTVSCGGGTVSFDGTNLKVNGLNLTTHKHPGDSGGVTGGPM